MSSVAAGGDFISSAQYNRDEKYFRVWYGRRREGLFIGSWTRIYDYVHSRVKCYVDKKKPLKKCLHCNVYKSRLAHFKLKTW